jgi:hypothetical protein
MKKFRRTALRELLKKKQSGEKIEAPRQREPAKVISLMRPVSDPARPVQKGGSLPTDRKQSGAYPRYA